MHLPVLVTAPELTALSLAEAKRQVALPADDTEHDDLLMDCIRAAEDVAQDKTGRQLVEATYTLTLDGFPVGYEPVRLPLPPLQDVESVQYRASWDSDLVELSSDQYRVEPDRLFGLIQTRKPWPSAVQVVIRFRAGYPVKRDGEGKPLSVAVPNAITHWLRVFVATAFERPEAIVTGTIVNKMPRGFVDGLLDKYRVEFGV